MLLAYMNEEMDMTDHDKTIRLLVQDKGPEIVEKVEEVLVERHRYGALISEVDFLAGAMVVIQLLIGGKDAEYLDNTVIPPIWIFGPMGNRSIIVHALEKQGADEKFIESVEKRELKRTYQLAQLDQLVRFVWTIYKSTEAESVRMSDMTSHQTLDWLRQEARVLLDDMWEEQS